MPKVAIFYDWLNTWGGAERVLLDLITIFPHSDLYSIQHDPKKTSWLQKDVFTPNKFLQSVPYLAPFSILVPPLLEKIDFSHYDCVISLTSMFGHCLITQPKTTFICYWLTPNRYLYSTNLFSIYKKIDKIFSTRPDLNLSISKTTQSRLKNIYNINSKLCYPAIDTDFFSLSKTTRKNFFLVVSRLVPYKKVDLAIAACQKLKQNLVIVGTGREDKKLQSLSNPKYTSFLSNITDNQLRELYQSCTALLMTQAEDFGLSSLEAQSCGAPVIYFDAAGATETMSPSSGVPFSSQTPDSLVESILSLSTRDISPNSCRQNALRFSKPNFMLNFKSIISHANQNK